MNIEIKSYSSLSKEQLFSILKMRVDVFVVEQECPYHEIDALDNHHATQHIMIKEHNMLCGYARCYDKSCEYTSFGRVLLTKQMRGKGLGVPLIEAAIKTCKVINREKNIYISAQTYLLEFYKKFGFESVGEVYLEDGIPHHDMVLTHKDL
jgi:ElaA protein